MVKVEIYTKSWCPFCTRAKDLLDQKGVSYEEIDVTSDATREFEMVERSGRYTVPQIIIDDYAIGGTDELRRANSDGQLDALLASNVPDG